MAQDKLLREVREELAFLKEQDANLSGVRHFGYATFQTSAEPHEDDD